MYGGVILSSYIGMMLCIICHGPPKPTFLELFMVNNLVFRWPKPSFFMGFGGSWWIPKNLSGFNGMSCHFWVWFTLLI